VLVNCRNMIGNMFKLNDILYIVNPIIASQSSETIWFWDKTQMRPMK
jgi:hypothetical protein